jgi:hypothetical protein
MDDSGKERQLSVDLSNYENICVINHLILAEAAFAFCSLRFLSEGESDVPDVTVTRAGART